jgi:DNA processing protein
MNVLIQNRDDFIFGLLALQTVPNLGPVRIRKLVQALGNPLAIFEKSKEELRYIKGINQQIIESIQSGSNFSLAEKYFNLIRTHNIGVFTLWDEEYPSLLQQISDPPPILFYKGHPDVLRKALMVIVGTRRPTSYGIAMTKKFSRELSQRGIPIVSGLARGVDTLAHQTALRNQNSTIAVLASGVDYIYPPENKNLSEQIIEKGILVSEFPPGIRPEPSFFTRRNRIISGLSEGVIVIEAGKSSGALITANYAIDQNREVFAIPGHITNPQAMGCLKLIQDGAKCLISIEDIFDELPYLAKQNQPNQPSLELLTEVQSLIMDILGYHPIHIDEILHKSGLNPQELNSVLFDLEMEGYIQQLPGKLFVKS